MNNESDTHSDKRIQADFRDGITIADYEKERDIYTRDQKRISNRYNSKTNPTFRLIAEYLREKFVKGIFQLDKEDISEELNVPMGTLNVYLSDLNRFEKLGPARWISVQGKVGIIEAAGANSSNSNKWIKKNWKSSVSRTARIYQTKTRAKFIEEEKELQEFKNRQNKKITVKNNDKVL